MGEFWRKPELGRLEARRSCQENSCYRAHSHDGFSIGLIDSGTSVLAGHRGGAIQLIPGDVVLIPAGHVHDCNPDDGSWRYQMIHMDQRWAAGVVGDSIGDEVFSAIAVLRRPEAYHRANEWSASLFADASPQRIVAGFRALAGVLAATPPRFRVSGMADAELMNRLADVLRRLEHDESNPPLGELAASVGMSVFQLVRTMKRATGLTPLAWRQNVRIGRARRLLRGGESIVETALALGFVDQSHFHRVFRAYVAASPGSYRG